MHWERAAGARAGSSVGAVARIDVLGRPAPALRAQRPSTIAEGVAGTAARAAVMLGCTGFALAAAERPSFLAPPTLHGGDPAWLAGPLAGRWPSLSHAIGSLQWNASLALLALCAVWLLAVACARP